MSPLPRSTPEEQGLSSAAVTRFVDALESSVHGLHSLMLVRHGHVVAEGWWAPYSSGLPHSLFSISKSFAATAVGFAVAEGLLALDDTVVSRLPDDAPAVVGDNLAAMTVRHLLTMTTGHAADTVDRVTAHDENWSRAILALPVELTPGRHFVYDTGATYLLSAIVQRLTGQRMLDYLTPRLLQPLGIVGATWEQCPRGIDTGGWGLSLRTEDVAAFGLAHLQGGRFGGAQVIPADWVAEATALQVENGDHAAGDDNVQGYGYQFWRSQHGAYRADGAFGQVSLALPAQDTLLVITGGNTDKQHELDAAWNHLLPVLGHDDALPADAAAHRTLLERLARLAIALPAGETGSVEAARLSGRRFDFPTNAARIAAATLDFGLDASVLTVVDAAGEHRIDLGHGHWRPGTSGLGIGAGPVVASAGAWADDTAYIAALVFVETPFVLTLTFDFREDEVTLGVEQNVSFGATQLLRSVGRSASMDIQE